MPPTCPEARQRHELLREMSRNSRDYSDDLFRPEEARFVRLCRVCTSEAAQLRPCPSCGLFACARCCERCERCSRRVCVVCTHLADTGRLCTDCYATHAKDEVQLG